jgi:hypothetical protein
LGDRGHKVFDTVHVTQHGPVCCGATGWTNWGTENTRYSTQFMLLSMAQFASQYKLPPYQHMTLICNLANMN